MPRYVSPSLQSLIQSSETFRTVDLKYLNGTIRRFSDSDVSVPGRGFYSGNLTTNGFSAIKRTRDNSSNRVSITAQNLDKILGLDIASDSRIVDLAEVVVGRFFTGLRDPSVSEWRELFTGRIAFAEANPSEAMFEVISETEAAGICVATKNLGPSCTNLFRGFLCGYAGALTTCNKQRKSSGGCRGRGQEHRLQSWEFAGQPIPIAPGAGGNDDGGIGSGSSGGSGSDPSDDGRGSCFCGDTPISTTRGEIPIEELCERFWRGEQIDVYAFNPATMRIHVAPVVNAMVHETTLVQHLRFESGAKLRTTPEHNFQSNSGKRAAGRFRLGDAGFAANPKRNDFESVKVVSHGFERRLPIEVFNLTIGFWHTYLANGIAVYNTKQVFSV